MKNLLSVITVVILAIVLAGCFTTSENPAYTPLLGINDPSLEGVWEARIADEEPGELTLKHNGGSSYTLVQEKESMPINIFWVGTLRLAEVKMNDEYLLVRLQETDGLLKLAVMNVDWFEDNNSNLEIGVQEGLFVKSIIIKSGGFAIRTFLLLHGQKPGLWVELGEMKKISSEISLPDGIQTSPGQ